jgi:hypothetical protein
MAKKDKSFAAKVARASHKKDTENCSVCGEPLTHSKVVFATRSESGSWKPKTRITAICKCNRDLVYGGEK